MSEPIIITGRLPATAILASRAVLVDGINANLVHNGITTRLLGIRPPTADFAAATSAAAGGVTAGVHLIAVTFAFIAGGQIQRESNIKAIVTAPVAPGDKKIDLSALPLSDDDQVNARVVYMSKAGASELFRVTTNATIEDNSTTTYSIDITDAALGAVPLSYANEFIPSKPFVLNFRNRLVFWGAIPYRTGTVDVTNGSTAVIFNDALLSRAHEGKRFWVEGDTLAYVVASVNVATQVVTLTTAYQGSTASGKNYTLLGNTQDLILGNQVPDNVEGYDIASTADVIIPIDGDESDPPTGLMTLRDMLILGTRQKLRAMQGDPSNSPLIELIGDRGPLGLASHWAWAQVPEGPLVFYSGAAGVFGLTANVPFELSKPIRTLFANRVNHTLDDHAHAVWYGPRSLFMLWVARAGSTRLVDLCLAGDFSDYPNLVSWWEFKLPASISRIVPFQGVDRLVLGDYWGAPKVWDGGSLTDGAVRTTQQGALTACTSGVLTDAAADFRDFTVPSETDPFAAPVAVSLAGVQVTITSGAGKGQQRFIASNTQTALTLDTRADFGGVLDPVPEVGDTYALGWLPSYWESPDLTLGTLEKKRWLHTVPTTEKRGASNRLELRHYTDAAGTMQGRSLTALTPALRQTHRATLTGRSTMLRLRYGNQSYPSPNGLPTAQPFYLGEFAVLAGVQRGIR